MTDIYHDIEAEIPRLRRYARALVRDVSAADDLVQECLTRALAKLHLWQEGSNLRAWLFTILHNQHVNIVRRSIRTGPTVDLDDCEVPLSQPASQEKHVELCDLDRALNQLPAEQRAVILLVGLEGMSYGEVARNARNPGRDGALAHRARARHIAPADEHRTPPAHRSGCGQNRRPP